MSALIQIQMPIRDAVLTAVLGYAVVFAGIAFLLLIIVLMGKIMAKPKNEPSAVTPEPQKAPGSAGELKLYGTDPKDAAMIMAIVADTLGKSLNELRFISIREVGENEIQSDSE